MPNRHFVEVVLLSPKEAAAKRKPSVSEKTMQRWLKAGVVAGERVGKRGRWRVAFAIGPSCTITQEMAEKMGVFLPT